MPVSRVLIGVDLDKIAPIPGAITMEQDITTNECYTEINKHLSGSAVDVYEFPVLFVMKFRLIVVEFFMMEPQMSVVLGLRMLSLSLN
jgi:23S rRNA U2552 (ribose-2'-O)-methylase RlmE/FtsJ